MPSPHYRRRLRHSSKHDGGCCSLAPTIETRSNAIQTQLLDIMDIIAQRVELSDISNQVNSITSTLSRKLQLYDILDNIEQTAYSIVQNITDGIDFGIVTTRIQYFRELLKALPEGAQDEYRLIGCSIIDIINLIAEGIDITVIGQNIASIKAETNGDVAALDAIDLVQDTICSIVQNMADGVDTSIIMQRIIYLRELIGRIKCP